MEAYFDQDRPF